MSTPTDAAWLDVLCERQRLDLIGDLLGGLAHELNNSLSVVSGYQDLMLEALEGDGESRQELLARAHTVHTWTGTALTVARRLHDASRQMRQVEGPTDVDAVVAEGVELCRYRCERDHLLLVCDLDGGQGRVAAPAGLLLQVVVNLVQNAREAIARAAGDAEAPEGTIRVATQTAAGTVRVVVEDDGPGVAAAATEAIFGLGVSAKTGPGHGYGLPVSRRIAQRWGGALRAEAGEGGRFVFELPSAR